MRMQGHNGTVKTNGRTAGYAPRPLYRLEQVVHRYGARVVLDIPQLEIEPGEFLAIVGPSGAGKSTLLRLLNFLEPPSVGRITFRDCTVAGSERLPLDLRRQITTVFQRPVLLSTSVRNNVAYGLQLRGRRTSPQATTAALTQLGLAQLADAAARTLSGGEMQRVALARAMVIEPQVLLLDEPTANLDPYNVQLIETNLRTLHQEQGTTCVMVTHNVFQARRLATRVALLLEGRIVEIAETGAFFEAPHDTRTAAFVRGDMIY